MDKNYILFGEIIKEGNIKEKLVDYLGNMCNLKIKKTDIKIKNKIFTINKYYCSGHKLKAIYENFNILHNNALNGNSIKNYSNEKIYSEINEKADCIQMIRIKNQFYYNIKQLAINDLKYFPNKKLFSKDLSQKDGCKRFYIFTYEQLWNIIKTEKNLNYYENYENEDPLRLFIDVDYKIKSNNIYTYDELLEQVMETIDDELEKYKIKNTSKIILSSNRQDKNSAHIIYPKVYFRSIKHMKLFMMDINSTLIDDNIIDPCVYRVGCFRLFLNCKKGINVPLIFYKGINYIYKDNEQIFYDTLLKNITPSDDEYVPIILENNIPIKTNTTSNLKGTKKVMNETTIKLKGGEIKGTNRDDIPIETLNLYLNLLGKEYGGRYYPWRYIGIIIYNCNSTEEGFNIWDKWSQKFGESYGGRDICTRVWNKFKKGPIGIGSLMKIAKESNPIEYSKINNGRDIQVFETIKYEKQYNLDKEGENYEKIKNKSSIVTEKIDEWMSSECKTLIIKSPYGTGKTTLIGSLIEEYKPQRILFLSYRQSLSNSLYGTFKKHKFKNYLDKHYSANKLICQLESLKNIEINGEYMFNDKMGIEIPSYDLVIMDEIESVLNHFESPTVVDKEYTFDLLTGICKNSKKILALDGDFGNRGYDHLCNYGTSIILENSIKKNLCIYIFTNNLILFEKNIDESLNKGKKIVIISMTSKMSEHYFNKYNKQYKCIIHNSHTDDLIKLKLKDVHKYWTTCQLLIYTPSVEAGVDFDLDYFDNKYVVLSAKSCSPRALCQMISRVRRTTNNVILTYLGKMHYMESSSLYTYKEVEAYVQEMHNKFVKPRLSFNETTEKYYLDNANRPFMRLTIYNEQEKLNKHRNYFVPQLVSLLKNKGHICKLLDDDQINSVPIIDHHLQEIIDAPDITNDDFIELKLKQESGTAMRTEKCAIEKHLYKNHFHVDVIDDTFMKKYYKKINILKNLKYLLGIDQINPYHMFDFNNAPIKFHNAKKTECLNIIKELILFMGFDINHINHISIDKPTFEKNIDTCKKSSKLFTQSLHYRQLFELNKCKFDCLTSIKAFLGFINKIINEWGLVIESKKTTKKVKKIITSCTLYKLNFYKNINVFLYNQPL